MNTPATLDDGTPIAFRAHPGPQTKFLASTCREILYGGQAGGGKSAAITVMPLRWIELPALYTITFRRAYPDLYQLLKEARRFYPAADASARYVGHPFPHFRFTSGAVVRYGHMHNSDDWQIYAGQEIHVLCFDELTTFTKPQYQNLVARVRGIDPKYPRRIRSTSNPGGEGHCVPFGDVLTPSGWVPIQEMRVGSPVFTVLPDGELSETVVDQVHSSWFDGEMVHVKARGLEMHCTPNHRVAQVRGDRFALVPFEKLPGQATILRTLSWRGSEPVSWSIERAPRDTGHQPLDIPFGDYAELLGWVLAEGHTINRPGKRWVSIAQSKPQGRDRIRRLLNRIGFRFGENRGAFTIYSTSWARHFGQFGLCRQKFIPAVVKNATGRTLERLFDALVMGDGHRRPNGAGTYYTTSKRLADDVAEIAIKLGWMVSVSSRQRQNRSGLSYAVNFRKTRSGGTEILTGQHNYRVGTTTKRRSQIRREAFSGPVYCIGVRDTHSFVIRQNGSVWVSGNSWVFERWEPWLNPLIDMKRVPMLKERFDEKGQRLPPAESGQVLWVRSNRDGTEEFVPEGTPDAFSRMFISARLEDNPTLMLGDPEYAARLLDNDPVRIRQLRDGDWLASYGARLMFKREHFRLLDEVPWYPLQVRSWDMAATAEKLDAASTDVRRAGGKGTPDYTVGTRYGTKGDGRFCVMDVQRKQLDPAGVWNLILSTAHTDGKGVVIVVEQEGGSSGKFSVEAIRSALGAMGYAVIPSPATGSKVVRARAASATSAPTGADEYGRVDIVRAPWNIPWLNEIEQFPDAPHDDQVDSWSHAHNVITTLPLPTGRRLLLPPQ